MSQQREEADSLFNTWATGEDTTSTESSADRLNEFPPPDPTPSPSFLPFLSTQVQTQGSKVIEGDRRGLR